MEKIENEPLNVDIARHGQAKYEQGNVSVEEAGDLTPEGREKVRENAEALADHIDPDEEVAIWASPKGRTIETAKIISEVLQERGIRIRKKGMRDEEYGIRTFGQLDEVKNFSWDLFQPLFNGGEVEYAGKKFTIDKQKSNPNNLSGQDYYASNAIAKIPDSVKKEWPHEYVEKINSFETYIDTTKRIMHSLELLKNVGDKPYRVIIVSHDALSSFMSTSFSKGEKKTLDPGEFLSLERRGDKMVVTQSGNFGEGDSETDVVDSFHKEVE